MFKQKLIPLASAALLLLSCGGQKAITVNINILGEKGMMVSEKFDTKANEKYEFNVSLKDLGETEAYEKYHSIAFARVVGEEEEYLLLQENADKISFSYNDKKISSYPGSFEDWIKNPTNDTYVLIDKKDVSFPLKYLCLCHEGVKSTDTIKLTLTCDVAKDSVMAAYFNDTIR